MLPLGVSKPQAKSIMFQLGMKNTGLAISLANAHFATIAVAITPATVGMVIHQITGPILATLFGKKEGESIGVKQSFYLAILLVAMLMNKSQIL